MLTPYAEDFVGEEFVGGAVWETYLEWHALAHQFG